MGVNSMSEEKITSGLALLLEEEDGIALRTRLHLLGDRDSNETRRQLRANVYTVLSAIHKFRPQVLEKL